MERKGRMSGREGERGEVARSVLEMESEEAKAH